MADAGSSDGGTELAFAQAISAKLGVVANIASSSVPVTINAVAGTDAGRVRGVTLTVAGADTGGGVDARGAFDGAVSGGVSDGATAGTVSVTLTVLVTFVSSATRALQRAIGQAPGRIASANTTVLVAATMEVAGTTSGALQRAVGTEVSGTGETLARTQVAGNLITVTETVTGASTTSRTQRAASGTVVAIGTALAASCLLAGLHHLILVVAVAGVADNTGSILTNSVARTGSPS